MRFVVNGLLIVFSCACVVGCRHKLAQQPLTEQQSMWAEQLDDWNWKWRLPYNAPVRGTTATGVRRYRESVIPPPAPLPPVDGQVLVPELPPVVDMPAPANDVTDVVLVPMDDATDVSPASGRVHEVTKGDTLSKLSSRYYGSPKFWRRIYEANREKIDSPDALKIGVKLDIPPVE